MSDGSFTVRFQDRDEIEQRLSDALRRTAVVQVLYDDAPNPDRIPRRRYIGWIAQLSGDAVRMFLSGDKPSHVIVLATVWGVSDPMFHEPGGRMRVEPWQP
jgi:hypothetical protein